MIYMLAYATFLSFDPAVGDGAILSIVIVH
jgi:hypothetical protein